jgi:hypothetical protein
MYRALSGFIDCPRDYHDDALYTSNYHFLAHLAKGNIALYWRTIQNYIWPKTEKKLYWKYLVVIYTINTKSYLNLSDQILFFKTL